MFESIPQSEIQHSRRQTFSNHLTKKEATIIAISVTYQLNLRDVFDFLRSKQCKIRGITRLKRMTRKQFAPLINQIQRRGILNDSDEVYKNECQ